MNSEYDLRRKRFLVRDGFSKKTLFNVGIGVLLLYFLSHAIYGNRGFATYFKLNRQISDAYQKLGELRSSRVKLENKVRLLRPESLDKDMLDEIARSTLGFAGKNENTFSPAFSSKELDEEKDKQ